jgi:Tfp pilus assembly protein PilN
MALRNPIQILGTGAGLEIRGDDLEVALVRSRWKGVSVVGATTLRDFRHRPPAEWGAEYQAFVKAHGHAELPATLALPRGEVMVRLVSLPPLSAAEQRSAVRLQVDTLHPYGEDAVYWSYSALAGSSSVVVVLAERAVVDRYAALFAEAGIGLRGVTVAAAAYYGAIRRLDLAPGSFLMVDQQGAACELYGESAARPVWSATFDCAAMPLEKAVAAAASELRIDENRAARTPDEVLGADLGAPATAFAIGLAAACPRLGWRLNLLPKERRVSSARWPVAATAAAAALTGLVALLLWLRGPVQDRRYTQELQREIRRLEAVEREVRALEQRTETARARRRQLEGFRRRPEADLHLVTEISRRLPPTAWLANLQTTEEVVEMGGTAESAAPLLSLLDDSGVVTGAAFAQSIQRQENRETFRIRAARRAAGTSPPPPAPGVSR